MKYVIKLPTEEKTYYLTDTYDKAAEIVFGCSYIWGLKENRRIFKTKKEAQATIRDMHRYNTGKDAYIEEDK